MPPLPAVFARFKPASGALPGLRLYVLAFAIAGAALGLRALLFPHEPRISYAMQYPAMVLVLYFCGTAPGLLMMVLSCLVTIYHFTPPYGVWRLDLVDAVKLACFVLTTLAFDWTLRRLGRLSADLRLAHARLSDSHQQLLAVIEEQTDLLFRFDARGRLILANAAARAAFGLDASSQNTIWKQLVSAEDHEGVAAELRRLSPDKPVVTTENRFHDADRQLRWGEFVHRAVFEPDGRLRVVQTVGRDVTERRDLQASVQDLASRLQDLYENAPFGYYSLDHRGLFCQANAATLRLLAITPAEAMGRLSPKDFFTRESAERVDACFAELLKSGSAGPVEFDLLSRDGQQRHVSITATAIRDAEGRFVRSRSVMYDLTELERTRKALQAANRQQAVMLDNDLVGILKLRDRRIVWSNRASERMFGYQPGTLVGLPARTLYASDAAYEQFGQAAYETLASGQTYRAHLELLRGDGQSRVWVDVSGVMLSAETGETMWMSLDISAMKAQQARAEHIAFHDSLTGLPNRLLLMDRLGLALQLSRRTQELLAVCFLDMNGFKAVNDSRGHAVGDELLRVVAQRLLDCVRSHDTVSRLGGDEFVLMLPRLRDRLECELVVSRIEKALNTPVPLADGSSVRVGASVGIACFPADGVTEDDLLQAADKAMYIAKEALRHAARAADGPEPPLTPAMRGGAAP